MIFWSVLGWLIMGALGLLLIAWLVVTIWGLGLALLEWVMELVMVLLCVAWLPLYWVGCLGGAVVRRIRAQMS